MQFFAIFFGSLFLFVSSIQAADALTKTPLDIPDISVVGIMEGSNGHKFGFSEAELSIQGYLYPSIRADLFLSVAKDEVGDYGIAVEEAFVTATNIWDRVGMRVGTKKIDFGKVNAFHPEQWGFISRPTVLTHFLGEEGLTGEGGAISYLFEAPFFLHAELGNWSEAETGTFYTGRVSTSFEMPNESEFGIGVSAVADADDTLLGIDATFVSYPESGTRWKFQNEILKRADEWGAYSFLAYRWNPYWETGLRYDVSDGETDSFTGVITHSLTETSKLRLEVGYDLDAQVLASTVQFVFGMGPHSHTLQ